MCAKMNDKKGKKDNKFCDSWIPTSKKETKMVNRQISITTNIYVNSCVKTKLIYEFINY